MAGQPLRQAEAAGDFARIQAHLATASSELDIPDGGVGDDSGVAVTKSGTGHATPAWGLQLGGPWAPVPNFSLAYLPEASPSNPGTGRPGQAPWLPIAAGRRQAWLQLLQV
jgi:hypothetical protein